MTNDSVTKTWVGGIVNKTNGKNNFDSVMHMIKNPRCQITTISYSSLVGFILKLSLSTPFNVENAESNVSSVPFSLQNSDEVDDLNLANVKRRKQEGGTSLPDADIEFYGLNESKTAFNSPIDTVVIKFAVLHNKKVAALFPYKPASYGSKDIYKETDTIDNYKKEALTQSKIYQLTASKGEPVCPSLIDFSHISDRLAIETFLDIVLKKCVDDESKHIIQYLKHVFIYSEQTERMYMDDVQLGIITMESASDYITAYDALWNWDLYGKSAIVFREQILTQVLRLYNETHLVHADFHMRNCLVKKNEDGSCRVYMIDFGRMVDADNLNQEQILIAQQYAVSKFHRTRFFVSQKKDKRRFFGAKPKPADLFICPNILERRDHYGQKLCENLLFFICSLEYMHFYYKYKHKETSHLHNIYYKMLDPATSLNKIAIALNNYYDTQGVYIQRYDNYNILKPGENYDRTLEDIQGDVMVKEKGANSTASPPRILQKRKEAIPAAEERIKKLRNKVINDSDTESMPNNFHFDNLGFVDSDSEPTGTEHVNYSFPNVTTSFRYVKGGRLRKSRKVTKRRRTNRRKSRRASRNSI